MTVTAHRDRSTRLALFGVLGILVGGMGVLLGLLHLLLPFAEELLPGFETVPVDPRSVAIGAMLYPALGVVMIWAGIGSLRRRRWVRSVMLTLAWTWLASGILALALALGTLDELMELAQAEGELPAEMRRLVELFVLGLTSFGGILLPGAFVWAYLSRDVLLTCQAADPAPDWSDRCPLPVLGLSLGLGAAGAISIPFAVYAIFPVFGLLLTGWPAVLLTLASGIVCVYLARATYALRSVGWWGTTFFLMVVGASPVVTFLVVDPIELFRHIGYPEEQLGLIRTAGRPLTVWGSAVLTVLSLVYMVGIRKHFRPQPD